MRYPVLTLAASFCCLAFGAQPLSAQVIEIGDDGTALTRAATPDVQWLDPHSVPEDTSELPSQAVTPVAGAAGAHRWKEAMDRTAARYALSPALLDALVWQESRWNHAAVSPKGARGLTQLMPATATAMGVDPDDPLQNLEGGARYLRIQLDRFGGDVERALAAYNAGPGRVVRAGGIPAIAETRAYVSAILGRLSQSVLQSPNR